MIPTPWVAVVLMLAVFRLNRLLSYDHFPPVARLRAWAVGEHSTTSGDQNARMGLTSAPVQVATSYRRETLHELLACVFCIGFWTALAVYGFWLWQPTWALYAAAPLALNAAAALAARWLDP